MSVVPRPLGAGRPRPEPEERWTLGPGRHEAAADDAAMGGGSDASEPVDRANPAGPADGADTDRRPG